jgi:hypothetical protein
LPLEERNDEGDEEMSESVKKAITFALALAALSTLTAAIVALLLGRLEVAQACAIVGGACVLATRP